MTNPPDDLIDPVETRLVRRVRSLTDRAIVPIDPVAIAASATAARPRAGMAGRVRGLGSGAGRLGWLLAGAALTVVLVGGAIGAGALNGVLGPKVPATGNATPTPVPGALADCSASDLRAGILGWDGAAGHRIATVRLANAGVAACNVPNVVRLSLLDATGRALITSSVAMDTAISIGPNDVVHTMVQVGNYCGPAAQDPATIAFTFDNDANLVTATPASDGTAGLPSGLSGIPPCNGTNGPTDDITMQPWAN